MTIKTEKIFFLSTYIVFFIAYCADLTHMILDIRAFEETLMLLLFLAFITYVATLLHKFILVQKNYQWSYFLLIIMGLDILWLWIAETIRFPIGDYLNAITSHNFNIYFYDAGGFSFIFLNFMNALLGLALVGIISLTKYHGKRKKA